VKQEGDVEPVQRDIKLLIVIVVAVFASPVTLVAQDCRIVDLMPAFWQVVSETNDAAPEQEIRQFRTKVLANSDIYSETGFGFHSETELDSAILRGLLAARRNPQHVQQMAALLRTQLPATIKSFQHAFPDFRCDFPIYLAPSLGKLDGAGRVIDHHQALAVGVDNVADEYTTTTLPIFLTHELFHRYHFQVAGFSDDNGDQEVIWRALWVEGLATYVSMVLNPGTSLQEALIAPPDLVTRAQREVPWLVKTIAPALDRSEATIFSEFFEYHQDKGAVPPRAGYYLGARIAQNLASDTSLSDLAHLQPALAKERVMKTLRSLR